MQSNNTTQHTTLDDFFKEVDTEVAIRTKPYRNRIFWNIYTIFLGLFTAVAIGSHLLITSTTSGILFIALLVVFISSVLVFVSSIASIYLCVKGCELIYTQVCDEMYKAKPYAFSLVLDKEVDRLLSKLISDV
jgi:hypothetical protein